MKDSVAESTPIITLVGPPNSGKTTLFNLLSGKNYKTVNYPGSTVQYSTSKFSIKYDVNAELLDSPGIISLIPNSPDEKVSVDSLYSHPRLGSPDIVICTIDASQLSRHLLLALQLIESQFKLIVVLTMNDILSKKKLEISAEKLSKHLDCDVIKVDGRTGKGTLEVIESINRNLSILNESGRSKPKLFAAESGK